MKEYSHNSELESLTSELEINIDNFSKNELLEMISKMILIRNSEYKIAEGRKFAVLGEVVVGAKTAEDFNLKVGDTVRSDVQNLYNIAILYKVEITL